MLVGQIAGIVRQVYLSVKQLGRFYLGFTAHQDYFTYFAPSQSLGGAKTGDSR